MSQLYCQERADKHCGEKKVTLYSMQVNKEKTSGTSVLKG